MKTSASVRLVLLSAAPFVVGACAHSAQSPTRSTTASAVLEPKSGSSATGDVVLTQQERQVALTLTVRNVAPGVHAVHIHEVPDCSAADASSAGEHWNPTGSQHGAFEQQQSHLGDIGNLEVGPQGTGTLTFSTGRWALGTGASNDVLQHALVVHEGVDDLVTPPGGNAGGRIACGVIVAVVGPGASP
jgi:Cu-Zn family superoxide dismutase